MDINKIIKNTIYIFAFILPINIYCQNQQINFHDTQGELSIDGSGASTYQIAIPVPPGVKDASPNISLFYSSNTKNGILGNGWSISGLSSITRTGKNIISDGVNQSISYTDNADLEDNFSLDGQRLIKIDQYNYVTEQFSNLKIKATFSGNKITSFEINYPDGSLAFYGNYDNNNANAYNQLSWSLTKWQDPNGNSVNYKYNKIKNSVYISEITWSVNKIVFDYKNKSSTEYTLYKENKIINDKLLNSINVYSKNTLFRKFELEYNANLEKNDFLKKVTEVNGNNERSNPILFSYNTTENKLDYNGGYFYGASDIDINNSSTFKMLGDYNGDGYMDLIYQGKLLENVFNRWQYNAPVYNLSNLNFKSNISSILLNNKLLQQNAIVKSENVGTTTGNWPSPDIESNFKLKVSYAYVNPAKQLVDIVTKEIPYPFLNKRRDTDYCMNMSSYDKFTGPPDTKFIEGDFNGDGLSEIIILGQMTYSDTRLQQTENNNLAYRPIVGCNSVDFKHNTNLYFVDLHKDKYVRQNISIEYDDTTEIIDFNGDGKQDIFTINSSGFYRIYSLDPNEQNFSEIARGTISEYKDYTGLNTALQNNIGLISGNFNSDNKTDFLIPKEKNNSTWVLYESTGKDYVKKDIVIEPYKDIEYSNNNKNITQTIYYPVDINNDGRTDLVKLVMRRYYSGGIIDSKDVDTSFRIYGYTNISVNDNISFDNSCKDFGNSSASNTSCYASTQRQFDSRGMGVPLLGKFKTNSDFQSDIIIVKTDNGGQLHKFSFKKDNSLDSQINTINSLNGTVSENIEYTNTFTTKTDIEFPNAIIKRLPNQYIVKKINVTTPYFTKFKEFKYRDLIMNFNGLGFLGFRKMAQSNWINPNVNANAQIWSVAQTDPLLRGANTLNWSFFTTQNYLADNLIDNFNDNNLMSKTTNSYKSIQHSYNRFSLLPEISNTYDFVSGITTSTINTYDDYNNLEKSILSKTGNGSIFKTTITNSYSNTPSGVGNNYIVGRLVEKITKSEAYGDSYETKENFTYTNNNLTSHRTTVQNAETNTINYTYDNYGNTLSIVNTGKNILNNSAAKSTTRKIENVYDQDGRFLIKKTDVDKFPTFYEYNTTGQVTKEIDIFGITTTNNYDYWGKIITSQLSNNSPTPTLTSYTYYRDNNGWSVTNNNSQTKDYRAEYYNAIGKNIRNTTKGFSDGQYISTAVEYDGLGRKIKEYEPYLGNNPNNFTTFRYDSIGRVKTITNPTGLIVKNSYNGLTTTTVEGVRSKKQTKDAIGNTVQIVDNGTETINYTYYAHGGIKTTTYGSHVISTNYDAWGRKTYLLDPSVSSIPYTYSYTPFDEIKEEVKPEGVTTYKYDNTGKVIEKKTTGKSNIVVNYVYDPLKKGLLIKEFGKNENNSFSNEIVYDNYFRIIDKKEITPKYIFGQQYVYDEFGRVMNSESWTMANNQRLQTVVLNHQYNPYNGELNLLLDISGGIVGKVVWRANAKNAKKQLLNATLGELITIENTFDAFGNITNIRNRNGYNYLYSADYQYQVDRGLLIKRKDSHFNWEENFTYDNYDRLLSWSSPNGQNSNTYLSDGRINVNNQVGKYAYKADAKYKKASIELNSQGYNYYTNRSKQEIIFDGFKRPTSISEQGRGKINFEYGINNGRYFASKFDSINNKRTEKYYSQNGSIEIFKDENGNSKIINYISSPYSTPFMYVTELNGNTTTKQGFYYLARDFQGSIMAIYDTNANVIERRLFDPWGNIVKVQDKNGAITENGNATLIFSDRGYTGHEHFTEVGIIHMNGRVYDPIIKQFLSPDNYIQDPENSQSYNRYGYAWNNPLKYTDPSGEFFIVGTTLGVAILNGIISGAIISSALYTANAIINHNFGLDGFFRSAIIGGVMGGLGGISAYYAPIGILPGLAYGAGTGGVISLASSFLNTGDVNFKSFIKGLATGAISGGVKGYIDAKKYGANVWTGTSDPKAFTLEDARDMGLDVDNVSDDKKVEYKMDVAAKEYNEHFRKAVENEVGRKNKIILHADNSNKLGDGWKVEGDYFVAIASNTSYDPGTKALAFFQPQRVLTFSRIFLAKSAFASIDQLRATMMHELGHYIHFNLGLSSIAHEIASGMGGENWGHIAIYSAQNKLQILNHLNSQIPSDISFLHRVANSMRAGVYGKDAAKLVFSLDCLSEIRF